MSESNHPLCRDVRRDEQVRAAEDAAAEPSIMHRDLPEVVAALTERVARLEAVANPRLKPTGSESVTPTDGLRTEMVTLEVTHHYAEPLARWLLGALDSVFNGPGENVFVMDSSHEIARLTAERDAARAESDRLRAAGDAMAEALTWDQSCAYDAATTRGAIRQRIAAWSEARACVAELEGAAAPVANAGGYANNPHEPESLPEQLAYMMAGPFEKRVFLTREEVYAYGRSLSEIEAASMIFIPLYASPQPPRGWLTAEERGALKRAFDLLCDDDGDQPLAGTVQRLLARSTPPMVKMPPASTGETPLVRDLMWGEAIRAAGGEVGE